MSVRGSWGLLLTCSVLTLAGGCGGGGGEPVVTLDGGDGQGTRGGMRGRPGVGTMTGDAASPVDAALSPADGPAPDLSSMADAPLVPDAAPTADAPPPDAPTPRDGAIAADTLAPDVAITGPSHLCSGDCVCGDGVQNGDETAVDCGGRTCYPCGGTRACRTGADCLSGICNLGTCGAPDPNRPRARPLLLGRIDGLVTVGFPGFDAGFRCKSLVACTVTQTCHYTTGRLGSRQSNDPTFYPGETVSAALVRLRVSVGAASQCGNPPIKILPGNHVELTVGMGRLKVALPPFGGKDLLLYVAADGSTYWDRDLTALAARP